MGRYPYSRSAREGEQPGRGASRPFRRPHLRWWRDGPAERACGAGQPAWQRPAPSWAGTSWGRPGRGRPALRRRGTGGGVANGPAPRFPVGTGRAVDGAGSSCRTAGADKSRAPAVSYASLCSSSPVQWAGFHQMVLHRRQSCVTQLRGGSRRWGLRKRRACAHAQRERAWQLRTRLGQTGLLRSNRVQEKQKQQLPDPYAWLLHGDSPRPAAPCPVPPARTTLCVSR
jgi:hypothetical protein